MSESQSNIPKKLTFAQWIIQIKPPFCRTKDTGETEPGLGFLCVA